MKRRTLIRQLGTASLATTTLVGSAAASRPSLDLDREIDVSGVSGSVPLADVLDDEALAELPEDVDPRAATITVAEDTDVVAPSECCDRMPLCCRDVECTRPCGCCYCYQCES